MAKGRRTKRWLKIALGLFLLLIVLPAGGIACWLFWPDPGTLVGQSVRNDIPGLKRSLVFGADINGYSMWGWHGDIKGSTPLTAASFGSDPETVRFLLSRGADPNQRDGFGTPPICKAAIRGNLEICQILVSAGADPALPSVEYYGKPIKTAIEYAASGGHSEVLRYLTEQVAR